MKTTTKQKRISLCLAIIVALALSFLSSCIKETSDIPEETRAPEREKFTLSDGTEVPRYYYDYFLKLGNDENTALLLSYRLAIKVKIAEDGGTTINSQKKTSLINNMIYDFEDEFGRYYEDSVYEKYGVTPENMIQISLDEVLVGIYLQNSVNESDFEITGEEIEKYYNEHLDEYYSITFIYAFVRKNNLSEEITTSFSNVLDRENMYSFISKYSESDSKDEDVFLDVTKSKKLPEEILNLLAIEDMKTFDKFMVETSDKVFFLMCEYVTDLNSEDVVNEIIFAITEIKANEKLDDLVESVLAAN